MGSSVQGGAIVIAAGGDVGTGHQPPESAFDPVRAVLREADIRIVQVERLFTERGEYQFQSLAAKLEVRQHPRVAEAFATVPFDVLSFAGNHVGDWGVAAIEDTIDTFAALRIPAIGIGRTIAEARRPAVLERGGRRIAFLSYCSVLLPQYWATEDRPGCAPMRAHTFYEPYEYQPGSPPRIVTVPHEADLAALVADVRAAREQVDHVVVSLHWGLHYVPRPQQYQPVVAHAAIDAGACAILGHHPHQLQAVEIYRGAPIFYSLGNFAFHRRGGGPAYCMPNGDVTHKSVYSIDADPGHHYDYRRHWNESGIAYIELDAAGVRTVTFLPTLLDERGRPQIVEPGDTQFDTTRRYLEWAGEGLAGAVTDIRVDGGRYVLYERSAAAARSTAA